MGLDWERVVGEGGAYLIERAAAVQQSGRLSPTALRLVVEEAERLKFILTEEIARLVPGGDVPEAAIAPLRPHYQTRLDAAERVVAAAHRVESPTPTLPSPASEAGKLPSSGPTPPPPPTPGGGQANPPPRPSPTRGEGENPSGIPGVSRRAQHPDPLVHRRLPPDRGHAALRGIGVHSGRQHGAILWRTGPEPGLRHGRLDLLPAADDAARRSDLHRHRGPDGAADLRRGLGLPGLGATWPLARSRHRDRRCLMRPAVWRARGRTGVRGLRC